MAGQKVSIEMLKVTQLCADLPRKVAHAVDMGKLRECLGILNTVHRFQLITDDTYADIKHDIDAKLATLAACE